MAVEDLGSKPMIKASIGTKIPPPPTPPTLPNAAPENPMMDPTIILQPNFMFCSTTSTMHAHFRMQGKTKNKVLCFIMYATKVIHYVSTCLMNSPAKQVHRKTFPPPTRNLQWLSALLVSLSYHHFPFLFLSTFCLLN